jgi:tetratricopeptide (TPR) repeat protein
MRNCHKWWLLLLLMTERLVMHGVVWSAPSEVPGYVGSSACKACHSKQFDQWTGSHHDLAMQPANESTVLGNFSNQVFEHQGVRTRFYRQGKRFMVETQGADGHNHEFEISYTFGVTPLQQYLVGFPDGRYQVLTIAWDARDKAEGGQRWFALYPNEDTPPGDELHWLSPAHNWNHACAECHSTNLRKNYDASKDSFATDWSEIDVSCEACHGPGSQHAKLAKAKLDGNANVYPDDHGLVVQLKGGASWELVKGNASAVRSSNSHGASEVELCGRCHSRRTELTEDYRHGAPLSDSHRVELLEEGLYFPDGQIQDEVYVYGSFRQSRMYAEGVTCSDCHEPHSLKLRREGNAVCTACHQSKVYDASSHHFHKKDGSGGACVACHMPERTYMVIDPRRDHSLRIPRPDLAVKFGVPDVCTGCHKVRSPAWAESQVQKWYGTNRSNHYLKYAETFAAVRNGEPNAVALLKKLATDQTAPAIARATALDALGSNLGPASIQVLVNGLYAEDALERRAAVEALAVLDRSARWRLLSPLLDDPVRGVRMVVAVALADVQVASLNEADRPKLQRAFDEYLASERLNADRVEHWVNLAGFHARQGAIAKAEAAYAEALKRNSRYVPAYVNQADIYRELGREDDAEKVLQSGISALPDDANLQYALGLLLVRGARMDEALVALRTAYRLEPLDPLFGYVYGVALDSSGATFKALNVWKQVLRRHPNDRATLQALAGALYKQGEYQQAQVIARRLSALMPDDQSVVQLVAAIEAALSGQ